MARRDDPRLIDKFVRYKAKAMDRRIKWDDWVELNKERLTKDNFDKTFGAWYEGYNQGERSLDETK